MRGAVRTLPAVRFDPVHDTADHKLRVTEAGLSASQSTNQPHAPIPLRLVAFNEDERSEDGRVLKPKQVDVK